MFENSKKTHSKWIQSLCILTLALSLILSTTTLSFARDTDLLYQELISTHENFEPVGSICEQAAKIKLRDLYPSTLYTIKTGVTYGTPKHSIGELDVVIFDNVNQQAVLIAEVKCWQKPLKALRKAIRQRARFLHTLATFPKLTFHLNRNNKLTYRKDQFSTGIPFLFISQMDPLASGFDIILDYTLEELMSVRDQLLSIKKSVARH